ncbi:4-carboxymuconolactone decarboxylase [Williamsia maris]|uniref:4-carboxymuconolactone decarboxylase /3-oxoadipate enol-lactonase n=1 Tax=Williamsia maris TaxID=72806 RepID=A0ABT1HBE5_9NOCA|nr:4-carboxymuconolactone decarboxylase [Williamsia maris]MCP2175574.1 4-carboxymuconolactone decarboxylase /3-oxoadipate enol-lactonase [Williamsia maris]
MNAPVITLTEFSSDPDKPLLILGPSLGTSTTALWATAAALLTDRFHVVGWDLPGHGDSAPASEPFTIADLGAGVIAAVDHLVNRSAGESFGYAGVSVGGAVGLSLLLEAPERIGAAVVLCTGARIGETDGWRDRAAGVRASGTASMVDGSIQRWFAPGFLERRPHDAEGVLDALRAADDESYAATCEALAAFDVRDRLAEIGSPVLAVAGDCDVVTPTPGLAQIADGVGNGGVVVLDNVAHLGCLEAPNMTAHLISTHLASAASARSVLYDRGLRVRREVLGEAHVDRATAAATDLTRDFQQFITQYAWGGIWTRPGLDRRSRSMITLTALIARGHHDEFAMHVRAARTNGLTTAEISEVILQSAIYCGVPDANTAFKIAQRVLDEEQA